MTLFGGVSFLQGNVSATQRPLLNLPERAPDPDEVIRGNNDKLSREIRVAMPAEVISFDAEKQTVVVQPLIREKIINRQNGQVGFVSLPQLVDVPVCFPQAGNFVLTMPVQAGDEVLLVFADTNIDSWWASGGIQNWNDRRRHDLSDAIAVVGLNSVPGVIPSIANDATELRTKDGNVMVSVADDSITLKAGSFEVVMTEDGFSAGDGSLGISIGDGQVNINGTLYINGHAYLAHKHGGVTTGPGVSGVVIP